MNTIKVEAVTVCVGYSDFLAETAKYNRDLFDRWLVVTSPDDEATREVCRKFSLPTLLSDAHKRHGDDFAKGRLIERGLQQLSAEGWRLHLDADMVLPSNFRKLLDTAQLDERKIYGVDRVMVPSWEKWQELQNSGWVHHDYHNRLTFPPGLGLGSRWVDIEEGYCPLGAFQLFHSSQDQWRGTRSRRYPASHNTACRTDIQFALSFDRPMRELLPEIIAIHLESQPAKLGANWKGRTTKHFGPQNHNSKNDKAVS